MRGGRGGPRSSARAPGWPGPCPVGSFPPLQTGGSPKALPSAPLPACCSGRPPRPAYQIPGVSAHHSGGSPSPDWGPSFLLAQKLHTRTRGAHACFGREGCFQGTCCSGRTHLHHHDAAAREQQHPPSAHLEVLLVEVREHKLGVVPEDVALPKVGPHLRLVQHQLHTPCAETRPREGCTAPSAHPMCGNKGRGRYNLAQGSSLRPAALKGSL